MSWGLLTPADVLQTLGHVSKGNRHVWPLRWERMCHLVRPFEADRAEYDNPEKHPLPVLVEVHPTAMKLESRLKLSHGLLVLGFIMTSQRGVFCRAPLEARALLSRKQEERRLRVKTARATSAARGPIGPYDRPTASALSTLTRLDKGDRPECGQHVTFDTLSQTVAFNMPGHALQPEVQSASSVAEEVDGADTASVHSTLRSVVSEGSSYQDIRDLETQVLELTNQLRSLQTQSMSPMTAPHVPPPYIVMDSTTLMSSTRGGTIVTLTLTYLDPDHAPYTVLCDDMLVPCVVTDQRFITFITHARERGCVPVKVLCGNPCRQYCRSVWLEYKTPAELEAQNIGCVYVGGDGTEAGNQPPPTPSSSASTAPSALEGPTDCVWVPPSDLPHGQHDPPHILKQLGPPADCDSKSNHSKSNHTSELKSNDDSDMDHDMPALDETPFESLLSDPHAPSISPAESPHAPLTKEMLQLLSSQQHQRLAKRPAFTLPAASEPPASPTHSHYSRHSAPARILVPSKRKGSGSSQGSGCSGSGSLLSRLRTISHTALRPLRTNQLAHSSTRLSARPLGPLGPPTYGGPTGPPDSDSFFHVGSWNSSGSMSGTFWSPAWAPPDADSGPQPGTLSDEPPFSF
eukprot:GGOE01044863.1.p1 GENE.GGOE01044863.1~~GGOE01044863.1.p1  ORF type:complete len:631 (-),score=119.59 GGOE01044863.1:223-2115(-)